MAGVLLRRAAVLGVLSIPFVALVTMIVRAAINLGDITWSGDDDDDV